MGWHSATALATGVAGDATVEETTVTSTDPRELDQVVAEARRGGVSRRQFLSRAAAVGVGVTFAGALAACGGSKGSAAAGDKVDGYPLGKKPIASDADGAVKWWLEQTKGAVDWQSPDVVLTDEEITKLKAMKPKLGHEWYGLFVPAIAGWNEFWLSEVKKWAPEPVVYDVQGKADRDIKGAQALVGAGVKVAGTLSVNWTLFSAAMKKFHTADIPTTSVVAPSSAFYPTTSTIMPDQVANAQSLVKPMAEILRANNITESDVVFIPMRNPTYFDIARDIGLKQGVESAEVQGIAKLNYVRGTPGGEANEVEPAVAQILQSNPKAHVIAVLSHAYVGAAAAVKSSGRKDVWVIAFDLDQGTATQLLSGGWPVAVTYSLPIQQLGVANANIMGKILLGKKVPLIVTAEGSVATAKTVKESYAHDWGGRTLPWS